LKPQLKSSFIFISIKVSPCHEKSSSDTYVFAFTALAALLLAVSGSAQTPPPKAPPPTLPPGTIEIGAWQSWFDKQDVEGSIYKLSGKPGIPAEIENAKMVIRGDQIEYDQDTGQVKAEGHVYFRDFEKNEQIWASRLEYDTEEKKGKFWDVRGETHPRVVARPGILTVDAPFYFQASGPSVSA